VITKAGSLAGGTRFYTAGKRGVQIWDAKTFQPAGKLMEFERGFRDIAVHPEGRRVAAVLADGSVVIRDAATGEARTTFQPSARQIIYSPDGKLLLVMGDKTAHTWDAESGKPVSAPVEQAGGSVRAKFSPDGKRVLQWSARQSPGQTRPAIWNAATGKVDVQLPPHWQGILDAAWSADGGLVATGGADNTALISDSRTGDAVVPPIKHAQKVASVGFVGNGTLAWTMAEKELAVWSTLSGEPVTPRLRQSRKAAAVTSCDGGRYIVVASLKSAPRMWDLSPDRRNADDLKVVAHAMSGHALVNETSALRPLRIEELRAAWEGARKIFGAW
jgi:WD40 repeat protein